MKLRIGVDEDEVTTRPANPRSLRIGVDMDGVIADFDAAWTRAYQEDFGGERIKSEDIKHWFGAVEVTHFETSDDWWAWLMLTRPHLFRTLEPYQGALRCMRRLAQQGHELVVISAKHHPTNRWDAFAWLAEHQFPTREVHFTGHDESKAAVPACDVYIDDGPHNVAELVAAHPYALVVQWCQPWSAETVPGAVGIDATSDARWRVFERRVNAHAQALAWLEETVPVVRGEAA